MTRDDKRYLQQQQPGVSIGPGVTSCQHHEAILRSLVLSSGCGWLEYVLFDHYIFVMDQKVRDGPQDFRPGRKLCNQPPTFCVVDSQMFLDGQ